MSSLSAATTHDPESPSTPTYPNGEPILYTGNPAELTGILEALNEHFVNNGLFQPLLMHGAVLLRNGKVAVDSFTSTAPAPLDPPPAGRRPPSGSLGARRGGVLFFNESGVVF